MKRLAGFASAAALVFTVACGATGTDAGITTEVESRLAADDTASALDVEVETEDGVVTLTGSVENMAAREQAVQIARSTDGVRDVIDNLQVGEAAATTGIGADVNDAGREVGEAGRSVGDAAEEATRDAADAAKRGAGEARDAVTDDGR